MQRTTSFHSGHRPLHVAHLASVARLVVALACAAALLGLHTAVASADSGWTAYNDCVYVAGESDTNITTYSLGGTGALKDYAGGDTLPVSVALTASGDYTMDPAHGVDTASGTDAYTAFHGIVGLLGLTRLNDTNAYVDLTFTGLDPSATYTFVTTANRGDNTVKARYTQFTISGVDAATNASGPGVVALSEAEVAFSTGYNTAKGYVARWTDIDPGDDSFSVRASVYSTSTTDTSAYGFGAFMLQEVAAPNTAPDSPTLVEPADEGTGVPVSPTLVVTVGDVDGDALDVSFYGREASAAGVFDLLGTVEGVASGGNASVTWDGLDESTEYEWHATASDGSESTTGATWSFTTGAVNEMPVAVADSYLVDEDAPLSVVATAGVLANDLDADGDDLSATLVSDVSSGTLALSADGSFTYEPDADYSGDDSFTYVANDGTVDSAVAMVTITVSPVNDAPVAQAQSVATDEDTPVNITLTGTDVEGDALAFSVVAGPSSGALAREADGSYTYTPDRDFSGTDGFTFVADDGTAVSEVAAVAITVSPVNDAPVVTDPGEQSGAEGDVVTLAIAASDVDTGDTLVYDATGLPEGLSIDAVTGAISGTIGYGASAGSPYAVTVTVSDDGTPALSGSATFTWTITDTNRAPVLVSVADQFSGEGDPVSLAVVASDADGDTLAYSAGGLPDGLSIDSATGEISGSVGHGTHEDSPYAVTVTAADDGTPAASDSVSFTWTVNDAPVADGQGVTVAEDGSVAVTLTGSDADGDDLTFTVVTGPAHGKLSGAAPDLTYTPDANYHGADSFTFTVNDGTVDSAAATVSITVTAVNDVPVADGQSVTTHQGAPVLVSLTGSDVDGDALTFAVIDGPTHGALSGDAPGLTYTPDAGYVGADAFTYSVNDGTLASVAATVAIEVKAAGEVTQEYRLFMPLSLGHR